MINQDQHGKCNDCGLDYDQARDSVSLVDYVGTCDQCFNVVTQGKVIARWVADEVKNGTRWHIFSNLHYFCPTCHHLKVVTSLLCEASRVVNVTSEFLALKKG